MTDQPFHQVPIGHIPSITNEFSTAMKENNG